MLQQLLYTARSCSGRMTGTAAAVSAVFVMAVVGFFVNVFIKKKMNCVSDHAVHLPQTTLAFNRLSGLWKMPLAGVKRLFMLAMLLMLSIDVQAITPPGTVIDNVATASFSYLGAPVTAQSNTATIVSTIVATDATITLYQFAQSALSSRTLPVPSQFATSGPPGAGFVVSPDPVIIEAGTGERVLDANIPQDLIEVVSYSSGEPIYVIVDDQDQNLDATIKETVTIVITSASGDREEILLTETGLDTGEFVGYVQSSSGAISQYDGLISLPANTQVSVTYTDKFDPADSAEAIALVDPLGVVFSSSDGSLVDGAKVSITDVMGNAVQVYGDDGISLFPSEIFTGSSVTDSGGTVYDFPAGAYRFPRLPVGSYKLMVEVADFETPSTRTIDELNVLPNAPWSLDQNASFAKPFVLTSGLNILVDLPIDVQTDYLVIEKSTSTASAAIGDFVQYKLNLQNHATNLTSNNIQVKDTLPVGLRYQRGSIRIDGVAATDPVVSDN